MTTYTIFMHLRATTNWLALTPQQRFEFGEENLRPILEQHADVRMRFMEAEAFHAGCSDIAVWETENLDRYQSVVENLRETKFWDHYFQVIDIIPTVENAYANHYGFAPLSQGA
ncbi:darcynin family protein [Aestuariispira ectoiniformans]|uniref:darcynin family protein n=1 Tax=Aestuariispira ectoiniformans TaxID=2775080 RepID=UPI00223BA4DE|nr:darcynin family protein [Aestuariispira ectoiniformans]